jgi:Putative regulator of cell autolysis
MTAVLRRSFVKPVVASLLTAVGVGVLLAAIQFAGAHTPIRRWPRGLWGWIAISLWWSPVVLVVGLVWKRLRSRIYIAAALTIVGVAAIVLQPMWLALIVRVMGSAHSAYPQIFVAWLDTNVILFVSIAGAWWAVEESHRGDAANQQYLRLRTSVEDARLHVLALQLQPHFIFNTLNLVSELAYRDVAAATATLRDLRSLLTESLGHAFHRETSLRDELRFLQSYLAIQQRRFRDKLTIRIDAGNDVLDAAVPHLVLQPIVENAIVHGLATLSRGGSVSVEAQRAGDRLVLSVVDNGAGFDEPLSHEGVGLTNTRLRLEQLYPADHRLTLKSRPTGAASTIIIPFHELHHAETDVESQSADTDAAWLDDAQRSPGPPSRTYLTPRVLVAMTWLVIAAAWTGIDGMARIMGGPRPVFAATAWINLTGAGLWIVLTPAVIWLARFADLSEKRSFRNFTVHLIAAVLTSVIHVTTWIMLSGRISVDSAISRDALPWFAWNVLAYVGIVAFASVADLAARRRERAAATMLAQADLRRTRTMALRLRLQPQIIIQGLDFLSVAVTRDPRRAERAITCMGNMLRILLESADREFMMLDDELALLNAYADVARAGALRGNSRVAHTSTIDVASPSETMLAAVTLAPLAAALGGSVLHVSITCDDTALLIEILTDGSGVDGPRLDELRYRLRATYGTEIDIQWQRQARGVAGCCWLPIRMTSVVDCDESWSAAENLAIA